MACFNNLKLVGTSVIDVGFEKREKLLDSRMVDFTQIHFCIKNTQKHCEITFV